MKTNHSFSAYMAMFFRFTLSAALISGSSFAYGAGSGEVVKSGDKTPRAQGTKKADVPTPEEIKMGAVKSPYKACEGVVLVERSERPTGKAGRGGRTTAQIEWDEKAEFWKNYPGKGCDDKKVDCTRKVVAIPDTHFYKSFDGTPRPGLFDSKESANEFLKRVADASVAKVKARIEMLKAKKACVDSPNATCQKDIDKLLTDLKAKIPEFRLVVARLNEQSAKQLNTVSGNLVMKGSVLIPKDFYEVKGKLIAPENMPNLSSAEHKLVSDEMDRFFDQAKKDHAAEIEAQIKARKMEPWEEKEWRAKLLGPGQSSAWIAPGLAKVREKNVADYNKLLGAYPELGYVTENDLAPKDMSKKLALAIKDAEETMSDMKDAGDAVSSKPGEVNKKRMGFAAHTQTIEEILAKEGDGRSCAVANATLNELATVKTKEGAIIGGLTAVTSIGLGVWGAFIGKGASAGLVAMMGSSAAAVGNTMGMLAFATGAAGGFLQTTIEVGQANDTIRDARVGVVKVEDATKAFENKSLTTAMGLLNLQGGSAYIATAVGLGIGATGAATKVLLSSILKNGAKGGGGPAAKEAEVLAANLIKAEAGDKAAQKAVLATAAAAEKATLGTVAATDRAALDQIAATGIADTNPDALKAASDRLAGMQGPNKAAEKQLYVEEVKALTASVSAKPVGDAARQAEVKAAIAEGAGIVPRKVLLDMAADPTWGDIAWRGWRALVAKMRTLKGSVEERGVAAWEYLTAKAGLPKAKREEIIGNLQCGGILPRAVTVNFNGHPYEHETEQVIMACAAPTSTSL